MSHRDVRAAIASAFEDIQDVSISPWYRQSTKTGHGFVQYLGTAKALNGYGFVDRWAVLICLPSDVEAAEKHLSDYLDLWVEAAQKELMVTEFNPETLSIGSGSVPCLTIQGNRAH